MTGWVDFRALKRAVSLDAVLHHYQVQGLRRSGGQLQGPCPIHRGDREDAFQVNLVKDVFHCFACQAGGDVLQFVAAMEGCSIREAGIRLQAWSGGQAGMQIPATHPQIPGGAGKRELVRKKLGANPPLSFTLTGLNSCHPYLLARGIQPGTAELFGVGFYSRNGLLHGRIVIPIQNEHGQLVAYAGRALNGGPPKYRLPRGFRKALELFNLHRAAATGSTTVIVAEGYFDCLRVHQSGFSSVVALMGCALSAEQERLLLDRFERVILMLDGDAAGRAASRAISAQLSGKCSVAAVSVPDGAQPDQLPSAAIRQLLRGHLEVIPGCSRIA